ENNQVYNNSNGMNLVRFGNATIKNNLVHSNYVWQGIGIFGVAGYANATILNNTLFNNKHGILISNSVGSPTSGYRIIENNITNNTFGGFSGSGIFIEGADATNLVSDVLIENNTVTSNAYGIFINKNTQNSTIRNNSITKSTFITEGGTGILVFRPSALGAEQNPRNIKIENNRITSNERTGISIIRGTSVSVFNNGVENNNGTGIFINFGNSASVIGNIVTAPTLPPAADGIFVGNSNFTTIASNTVSGFKGTFMAGISVGMNSFFALVTQNILFNNNRGIENFQNSFNNITNNNIFDNLGIGVLVEDSHNNIVSANTVTNSPSSSAFTGAAGIRVSTFATPSSNNNIVENNVVTEGFGKGIDSFSSNGLIIKGNTVSNKERRAIEVSSARGVVIQNNILTNNGRIGGRGILVFNTPDHVLVEGNTVTGHRRTDGGFSPGIDVQSVGSATIRNNNVNSNNRGIFVSGLIGGATIEENTLNSNDLNGIETFVASNIVVRNNVIRGNVSIAGNKGIFMQIGDSNIIANNSVLDNGLEGIFVFGNSTNPFSNFLIEGNHLSGNNRGIFVFSFSSDGTIRGNTVANNSLRFGSSGLGIVVNGIAVAERPARILVEGNSVSRNTDDGIHVNGGTDVTIRSNNVFDGTADGARGIRVLNAVNTLLENNTITGTKRGILVSSPAIVRGNSLTNLFTISPFLAFGIAVTGAEAAGTIIENNTITATDFGILSFNSPNVAVKKNTVINAATVGLSADGSNLNTFESNTVSGSGDGLQAAGFLSGAGSNDLVALNNVITSGNRGILLANGSTRARIEGNRISGMSLAGASLEGAPGNSLLRNDISSSNINVKLTDSPNTSILENNITSGSVGVLISNSTSGLAFSRNNLVGNTKQIESDAAVELSVAGVGNFWGRTTGQCFIPGTDSNRADVTDSFCFFAPVTFFIDTDNDGIEEPIDVLPTTFSNDFSDVPLGNGGSTSGTITDRAGLGWTVFELPNPAGVRIKVGGTGKGKVNACGREILVNAPAQFVVKCSNLDITVEAGSVELPLVVQTPTIGTRSYTSRLPEGSRAVYVTETIAPGNEEVAISQIAGSSELFIDGIKIHEPLSGETAKLGDRDADGIESLLDINRDSGFVDTSAVFSDKWSNERLRTDGVLGTSFGRIVERGGLTATASTAANRFVRIAASGAGTGIAQSRICHENLLIKLRAGESVDKRCGSVDIKVVAGQPEVVTELADANVSSILSSDAQIVFNVLIPTEVTITVISGTVASAVQTTEVSVVQTVPSTVTIATETDPSTGTITVVPTVENGTATIVQAGQETTVGAGQSATLFDQCPGIDGRALYNGCPFADRNIVSLHVIDQAKSGACPGGAGSCKFPIAGASIRVFDRNRLAGLTIIGLDGGAITLTKNPSGSLYDDIFESDVANSVAKSSFCTTDSFGSCYAGERVVGDYLVIVKYVDGQTGRIVYTGLPKSASDFVDSDGDTIVDLATKDFQIMKTIRRDGSVQVLGGSKVVVRGSVLEVLYPIEAVWDVVASQFLYPFIFISDSSWSVDVCAEVPVGYSVVGAYDEFGNLISEGGCTHAFVAGQTKVVAFDVAKTGSPSTFDVGFNLKARGPDGKVQAIGLKVASKRTTVESMVAAADRQTKGIEQALAKFDAQIAGIGRPAVVETPPDPLDAAVQRTLKARAKVQPKIPEPAKTRGKGAPVATGAITDFSKNNPMNSDSMLALFVLFLVALIVYLLLIRRKR
ncbi:MAG: right-handed parallel beta-helix repeat-containing protein, partial [Candidatus Woesearchaeota archaeon]